VVVTDSGGGTNPPASLVIKIMDDAPVARADTDTLTPGLSTADGNVLTGAGTTSSGADLQVADGGVTVVGVAAGSPPGGAPPGNIGVPIVGARGTLTLNADGSYTYVATGGGGSDVFTYRIRDTDGSDSFATLTINLGDAAPGNIAIPSPGGQVFEAGLPARGSEPAGSDPTKPTTTQTGTITFTSPHCREQLIVRKDNHAARRSQRNGRAEILIFRVQKIDQRASSDLVFLAVNGDGLPLRHELALQGGDAIRGYCSCCPGFVDGFERVALQAGMPHRFFRVTLGHSTRRHASCRREKYPTT
jgi:Bacterial Ig domain